MAKRPASGKDRPKTKSEDGPQDRPQDEDLDQLAPKVPGGSAGAPRKGILIRVKPEGWKALRHLAIEKSMDAGRTVTLQEVMLEAINDYLQKHGKPPVA